MSEYPVNPEPMFDVDSEDAITAHKSSPQPIPGHQVKGYLWTTRNRFKGIVWLDYSALNHHNCPSPIQAARHAFSRAVWNRTLGANAADLAGHVLFVPDTPWGGPVMVK